jgi:hypothetical protein
MNTRKYMGLFGLVLLIVASSLAVCYLQQAFGWFSGEGLIDAMPTSRPGNSSADTPRGSSGGVSTLNIGITVILFILLAFSILNIYSFFNAQLDREKADLRQSTEALTDGLTAVESDLTALDDRENEDYTYERNFQRLVSTSCPIFIRAAAAGHFIENMPRDTDLAVLKELYNHLPQDDVACSPLRKQLKEVIEEWDTDD